MKNSSEQEISAWQKQLDPFVLPPHFLSCVEETTSTMDLARRLVVQRVDLFDFNGPVVGIAIARSQTDGRGRLNRSWCSYSNNLLTTLIFSLELELTQLAGFSLAVGTALAECFNDIGVPIRLKWPNDILDEKERKLAGILIETVQPNTIKARVLPSQRSPLLFLVGIGVNLCSAPPDGIALNQLGIAYDSPLVTSPPHFISVLLPYILATREKFQSTGFSGFKDTWLHHANVKVGPLVFTLNNEKVQGTYVGLTDTGALSVMYQNKVIEISAGDINFSTDR
jgi:BirA family transcriptional regulator, biotin operon repressor / biotin---[acetyl-CoA-carboxylase] ligase